MRGDNNNGHLYELFLEDGWHWEDRGLADGNGLVEELATVAAPSGYVGVLMRAWSTAAGGSRVDKLVEFSSGQNPG